ncbi:MAG: 2-dehydropantoate 2-reductase [Rubrivivax sp.]|nr:2-dehydropantoate 2-reductase [Rubrivivax sp.]
MNICIVGLGAIGGLLAGRMGQRLPPGSVRLSALARGATLTAVQSNGLLLEDAAGVHSVQIHASDNAVALGQQDLVILAVKGPALAAVLPALRVLVGPQTQLLTAMNGVPWWFFDGLAGAYQGLTLNSVDPGGAVRAALPSAQVIGAVVHLSSTSPAPGRVRHGQGNALILGRATGAQDAALQAVADLLRASGFDITVSECIQREVWFKLWGNMTMNPVSALTGATLDRMLGDPLVRGFCSAVMLEAQAIGAAIGVPVAGDPEARHAVTHKLGAVRTSMLQDLQASRPLEIDALVGAVQEIGCHLKLATPHTDALLGLVRLMARERGLYSAAA